MSAVVALLGESLLYTYNRGLDSLLKVSYDMQIMTMVVTSGKERPYTSKRYKAKHGQIAPK